VNPLPLGGGAARLLPPANGNRWIVTLQPYDLQAVFIRGDDANVVNWSVEPDAKMRSENLKLVQEVGNRIHSLRTPVALTDLANADFEQPAVDGVIPGWEYGTNGKWTSVEVRTDAVNAGHGNHSLYMKVTASDAGRPLVWVRSKNFSIPKTGRFAIQALIRTRNANQQPPLRMSVDLLLDGKPVRGGYIPVPLGVDVDDDLRQPTGNPVPPVSSQWQLVVGQFDDRLVEGPNEVSIGFDLMGPGEVWIDDIRVFDTYFSPNEQNKLQKNVAMVKSDLERGKLLECQRYLNGYWPRFLLEHVQPPAAARVSTLPSRRTTGVPPRQPIAEDKSTFWDWVPRLRMPDLPFKRRPE